MKVRQVVQVQILGAFRNYTYAYEFEPGVTSSLQVGDTVELPPNQVQEEGSSGKVVRLGSDYNGPMKMIVRVIPPRSDYEVYETGPPEDPDGGLAVRRRDVDDMWAGEDVQ